MLIHGGAFTVGDAMAFGDAQFGPFLVRANEVLRTKYSFRCRRTLSWLLYSIGLDTSVSGEPVREFRL